MANVVQFPAQPVPLLRLRDLIGGGGKGVVGSWLPVGARARLRIRVQNLRRIPRAEWNRKQFRFLGAGLAEIKWEWGKVPYRIVGFDYSGFFVMLIGCTHKQGVYDPHHCLQTAGQRKKEVEDGKWRTIDFEP